MLEKKCIYKKPIMSHIISNYYTHPHQIHLETAKKTINIWILTEKWKKLGKTFLS